MSADLKTTFDLELNPFESSFALKDLLARDGYNAGSNDASSATASSATTTTSSSGHHSTGSGSHTADTSSVHSTVSAGDATLDLSRAADTSAKKEADSGPDAEADRKRHTTSRAAPGGAASAAATVLGGANKHQLRILNLQSANGDRAPGLTPPMFTPGGRRLPPIHLLPNAALGSPGTPGSMWSSLLSATSAGAAGAGAGADAQGNYAQFLNMMRKSGLTPNESNLRFALTPGTAPQGFNFVGTPGQITPGLHLLLGLAAHDAELFIDTDAARGAEALPAAAAVSTDSSGAASMPTASESVTPHAVMTEAVAPKVKQEAVDEPPPKRARKARKKPKDKVEADGDEDGEAGKRKQFLERNRVAASKCRQRKKQLFSKMESELAFYSTGYRELLAQVTQLRDQMLQLRGILTAHKECPSLVSAMGGFLQLQSIIGQTDFVAQAAAELQPNFTSMPSTIPTTLHAAAKDQPLSMAHDLRMAPAQGGLPGLLTRQHPANPLTQGQLGQGQLAQGQLGQGQLAQGQLAQGQTQLAHRPMASVAPPITHINPMGHSIANGAQSRAADTRAQPMGQMHATALTSSSLNHLMSGQMPIASQGQMLQNLQMRQNVPYGDVEMGGGLPRNYSLGDLASSNMELDGHRRVISTTDLSSKMGGASACALRPVASMADLQSHATPLGKHLEL